MKLVVVGVDADGRSAVTHVEELPREAPDEGFASEEIWAHPAVAGAFADRPRRGEVRQLGFGPGDLSWRLVRYRPGASIGLHRTDTADCDFVMEGQITLGLESGEVRLEAGDLVVLPPLLHAWRAGPQGCVLSAVLFGLQP
jgi:quercetin dioxygenase-like cupin family protein